MRSLPVLVLLLVASLAGCGASSNGRFRPLDGGTSCDGGPCPCATDIQCGGATPRCDKNAGRCVPCLPQNDNCPKGQRCISSGGGYACSSACVTDIDCPRSDGGAPTTCCNGACADTAGDSGNCGGCGKVCPMAQNGSAWSSTAARCPCSRTSPTAGRAAMAARSQTASPPARVAIASSASAAWASPTATGSTTTAAR